jgi:hypothetical protein
MKDQEWGMLGPYADEYARAKLAHDDALRGISHSTPTHDQMLDFTRAMLELNEAAVLLQNARNHQIQMARIITSAPSMIEGVSGNA